jgi:hypothetical protein
MSPVSPSVAPAIRAASRGPDVSEDGPSLSPDAEAAASRYRRDFAKAQSLEILASCRLEAIDSLHQARRILSALQVAIMDSIAGRGRTAPELARMSSQPPEAIEAVFLAACSQLAEHYQTEASDR